jgi:hypothetical protein
VFIKPDNIDSFILIQLCNIVILKVLMDVYFSFFLSFFTHDHFGSETPEESHYILLLPQALYLGVNHPRSCYDTAL